MTSRIALLMPEGGQLSAILIPSTSVLLAAVESYSDIFVFAIFYPCLNQTSLPVETVVQTSAPAVISVHDSEPTVLSVHSSPNIVPNAVIVPLEFIIASPLNVAFANTSANAVALIDALAVAVKPPIPATLAVPLILADEYASLYPLAVTLTSENIEPLATASENPSALNNA